MNSISQQQLKISETRQAHPNASARNDQDSGQPNFNGDFYKAIIIKIGQ